ncbi:MAG: HK97 family phage prohead protease [Pseudomonadota bacterium]
MTLHVPPQDLGLEKKYTALSALTETGEVGRLKGYASRFGEPDNQGDVVMPGAFAASLARLKEAGRSVKLLWQHDPARPIGVWRQVLENKIGLWVSGEVLTDIQLGQEAAVLMQAGAIDGLSIGYRVVRAEPNRETGGRNLLEIDLWEVSLVTFPMLPTARAQSGTAPKVTDDIAAALAEALAG